MIYCHALAPVMPPKHPPCVTTHLPRRTARNLRKLFCCMLPGKSKLSSPSWQRRIWKSNYSIVCRNWSNIAVGTMTTTPLRGAPPHLTPASSSATPTWDPSFAPTCTTTAGSEDHSWCQYGPAQILGERKIAENAVKMYNLLWYYWYTRGAHIGNYSW